MLTLGSPPKPHQRRRLTLVHDEDDFRVCFLHFQLFRRSIHARRFKKIRYKCLRSPPDFCRKRSLKHASSLATLQFIRKHCQISYRKQKYGLTCRNYRRGIRLAPLRGSSRCRWPSFGTAIGLSSLSSIDVIHWKLSTFAPFLSCSVVFTSGNVTEPSSFWTRDYRGDEDFPCKWLFVKAPVLNSFRNSKALHEAGFSQRKIVRANRQRSNDTPEVQGNRVVWWLQEIWEASKEKFGHAFDEKSSCNFTKPDRLVSGTEPFPESFTPVILFVGVCRKQVFAVV